ncbi:DUF4278 domain-containing protein [Leptolyngbya sp. FACHB-261]|uniref:DUF4278 domain-containing protein n=1 Tax=Leptolyngbya sp. FACHB-261 TaxID=2692806 RepID=UPI0016881352|nr:DUF4278 domain-containing protein [Leptolyngbya sp. FACHB-261]MBD2103307.1 DUF4278 domain-containing protein [Leptolyngbya sp. FACHB-261]
MHLSFRRASHGYILSIVGLLPEAIRGRYRGQPFELPRAEIQRGPETIRGMYRGQAFEQPKLVAKVRPSRRRVELCYRGSAYLGGPDRTERAVKAQKSAP